MTLADWRKERGLSLREAALRISERAGPEASITGECLRLLEAGKRSPNIATVDVIRRGTGGAVTRMDWPEMVVDHNPKKRGAA